MHRVRTAFAAALAVSLMPLTTAAARDELVIGIGQFPEGFHPNLFSHVAQSLVMGMTRRPFTAYDPDWNLICMLCTALPSFANGTAREEPTLAGTPGLASDYTIRPDAVWGDGTPITTDDVMFTWEIGRTEGAGVVSTELYNQMERIEVHDDKRFTVHWDRRACDFEGINDFEVVPAHLERAAFAEPREYRRRTLYETDTTNPGLYYGPYRITRVVPGAIIVLEKNPTWWGKEPEFERIVFRIIENTAALEANLLSGEIDYIAGEDGVTLDQAIAFDQRHGDDYNVVYKSGLIYEHVDLMLDNPILQDLRVRQALLYALDRQAISERLFEGRQPVAHTSVNPLDAVHFDDVPKYAFDPDRAVALLEEAGWTELRNGIRHNAAGERLSLEIMTTSGNRIRELVEQVGQSMWRDVGIDVRIRNQPPRVFFGQTLRERTFEGMGMYAWVSAPENIPRTTMHSDMIPTAENNFSGQNYTGFVNAEMDEVLERIQIDCGAAVQTELWNRIQTLYAENLPVLPLYFRSSAFVMPKWLKGVTPTGHLNPSTLWVEHWSAEE